MSHSMFGHMHGVLNVDKRKKLIAQFAYKLQDEYFEPNCVVIWQYDATINIC